jgi:L-iditol 2-dehydrogenase
MAEETMRAVVYLAPGQIELRHLPIPEPAAGELVVRVRAALTCGTDVKTYRRGHPKIKPPSVFGHEFAGDVFKVGAGVERFTPGMRVTANIFAGCGECFFCKNGQDHLCEAMTYNFGAFAEYHRIPAGIVSRGTFQIPAHVSYESAAILEPLITVVHGFKLLSLMPGETLAILGAGGAISLLHLQLASQSGARVIAIGHSDSRLGVAKQLGAHAVINAHRDDAPTAISNFTEGRGADAVLECAGQKETWEQAVAMVRRGGRVLWFGGLPGGTSVELDAARLHYGAINLLNTHGGTFEDAREAFELITSGVIDTKPLFSTEMPLEKLEDALHMMIAGEVVKVIIKP